MTHYTSNGDWVSQSSICVWMLQAVSWDAMTSISYVNTLSMRFKLKSITVKRKVSFPI